MDELTGLRSKSWALDYSTSGMGDDGRPVDILHDFYIPVLRRSRRYDRVAGYFRSSSLAAASQGFSAFVESGGTMRLIVGCDLDPQDIETVLTSLSQRNDEAPLAQALGKEIEASESWPAGVQRGVALLGWMIANKRLDLRVAFRMHMATRKPIPSTSTEDGYVHEKWAIFQDEHANAMAINGSLNESRTALVLNAESIEVHCSWWDERSRKRIAGKQQSFELLWNNQHPNFAVMPLPQAVRERLVALGGASLGKLMEIDGSTAAVRQVPPPKPIELLRWAVVRDAARMPNGRSVGIVTAPVAAWPHQEVVARALTKGFPFHYLLCDEVGLGKTIEAGLALRSLILSGLVRRALIAAPRSLCKQWLRELSHKFLLPFVLADSDRSQRLLPVADEAAGGSLFNHDLAIVSTGLLIRDERKAELQSSSAYDVVLVDEAHYARRSNSAKGYREGADFNLLFRTIDQVVSKRTDALWLATATPMQIHPIEAADMLRFTDRVGVFQYDPSLTQAFYEALGKLVRNDSPNSPEWDLLRNAVLSVKDQDPHLWQRVTQAVMVGAIEVPAKAWMETGRVPTSEANKRKLLRLIFACAPMSRVMQRHTRSLLKVYHAKGRLKANLADRHIEPLRPLAFNAQEQLCYDQLEAYCKELSRRMKQSGNKKLQNATGFLLCLLRLRFASSLFAIHQTLRRRRAKVAAALAHADLDGVGSGDLEIQDLNLSDAVDGDDEDIDEEIILNLLNTRTPADLDWERKTLDEMLETLGQIQETPSKLKELLRVLEGRRSAGGRVKQVVVFTRFADTMRNIVEVLRSKDRRMLIGTYSGLGGQYTDPRIWELAGVDRDEVKQRFVAGEIDVLVCTDAAAEGLNLQTADLLINFDLPWNPMKVEQRIGRIDRIGQRHANIYVLNLCYTGSVEEKVYGKLLERLRQAGTWMGSQAFSLLPVTSDEFRKLALGEISESELEAEAKQRMLAHRRQEESVEIPPDDLYHIYVNLAEQAAREPQPLDLADIQGALVDSVWLRDIGFVPSSDAEVSHFTVHGLDDDSDRTILTTSRKILEDGIPGHHGPIHFASFGNPVFDRILERTAGFELPPCMRRISIQVDGYHAELVGYAVATLTPCGGTALRLITRYKDLDGLVINANAELSDADIAPLRIELGHLARAEFDPCLATKAIERLNVAAAHAQLSLNCMVAGYLADERREKAKDGDKWWPLVKDLDALIENRPEITCHLKPISAVNRIQRHLLCQDDITVPKLDDTARVTAPNFLLCVALDHACAVADGITKKRAELETSKVLNKLQDYSTKGT